nr:hypothetical protein Iba_chr11aCG3900 [Ipomoea batatas]
MGACTSKPKEFGKKRIPSVAPTTPRKPDRETLPQEDEKASETAPAVEPSDSAPKADEVTAADVVPEKEKRAEAINENPVAEAKTISQVVINNTTTTEEEIKNEIPVVEPR